MEGPVAMMYEVDVGWVAENLGPNSSHWKRKAQVGPSKEISVETGPIQRKREGPTLLEELDKISRNIKRKKGEVQSKENRGKEKIKDGREAVAAELNDHPSMELPGNGISSGNSCSQQRGERK